MSTPQPRLLKIMRLVSGLAIGLPLLWVAWFHTVIPLLLALGVGCALISIRISQAGVARYGRRVPVTEMLALGRAGDPEMTKGGVAGYLMVLCFVAAGIVNWLG